MKTKIIYLSVILAFFASYCSGQQTDIKSLKRKLQEIIKPYRATVGIAILGIEDRDTLTINNDHHYPMQSVFKFPLAVYVLHLVDKGTLALNQKIYIRKKDLHPDTWSPLGDKYPDGNVDITIAELLGYTVSQSDNNGCDILFGLVKGPDAVNDHMHRSGINNIAIRTTEHEMTKAWKVQYTNWAEPVAYVHLLDGVYHKKYLSEAGSNFLMKIMKETVTGPKRLKGLLPDGTIVAHKTGTSGTNKKGMRAATNDVGIVTLPNGKHFAITVFVSNSMETIETNERIIAEIAKATFDFFNEQK